MWIPSHVGNETADKVTNLAIRIIPHPTIVDISINGIKT